MDVNTKANVIAVIVAAVISALISFIVSFILKRKDERSSLDSQLDSILRIAVEYPELESKNFTHNWSNNSKKPDEKYRRYEVYATLVFNYLSRVCSFFNFNEKKINEYIDMNGWVKMHYQYWHHPTEDGENESVYDKKFKDFVHKILGEIPQ